MKTLSLTQVTSQTTSPGYKTVEGFPACTPVFTILRADQLGMCFGVRDAINAAIRLGRKTPLTILGQLVHNSEVRQSLEKEDIRSTNHLSEVQTETVMITAHGVSDKRMEAIQKSGRKIVDATCPLVHKAHQMLRQLVSNDYYPVVIGKKGHVEVNGLTEDYPEVSIILSESDIQTIPFRKKIGVVSQTTQPIEKVKGLVNKIRCHFPNSEVQFADSVCYPTKRNQESAIELSRKCEVVIVVGGSNSNNTHALAETCRDHGARAYQVEKAEDLDSTWFENIEKVGLTAGTSTPESRVRDIELALEQIALKIAHQKSRQC